MAKLGDILLERGWVTPQQLQIARKRQAELGGRIGTCLLEVGALSEDLLLRSLSEQAGVPPAPIQSLHDIPQDVSTLLSPAKAIAYRAVPFRQFGGQIEVALEEVKDLGGQDELSFVLGKRVNVHIANEVRIAEALDTVYGHPSSARLKQLLSRLNRSYAFHGSTSHSRSTGFANVGGRIPEPRLSPPEVGPNHTRTGPNVAGGPTLRTEAVDAVLGRGFGTQPIPISGHAVRNAAGHHANATLALDPLAGVPAPVPDPDSGPDPAPHDDVTALSPSSPAIHQQAPAAPDADLADRLTRVRTADEVGELVVAELGEHFSRIVLFRFSEGSVRGWLAHGPELDSERLLRFVCPLRIPSVFLTLQQGGGYFHGKLPGLPAHRRLTSFLESKPGSQHLVVPIRLANRLIASILVDRVNQGFSNDEVASVRRLAAQAELAFHIVILRDKIRALSDREDDTGPDGRRSDRTDIENHLASDQESAKN